MDDTMLESLKLLRFELRSNDSIYEIAETEFGIHDAGSYDKDELIEVCVGEEYRLHWV